MNDLAKTLIVCGSLFIVAGLLVWSGFGKSWFGRLPGDLTYARGNFRFYFPLVTCLLLSIVLSLLLWIFRR